MHSIQAETENVGARLDGTHQAAGKPRHAKSRLSWPQNALHDLFQPPVGQVPALDALRSFAVLIVIAFHLKGTYLGTDGYATNWFWQIPFVRYGGIGVDLFFVLSGYLIGKQLWREVAGTGTIKIPRFLMRRGLRIWPLYYFFIAFDVLVLGNSVAEGWWADLVFISNYTDQVYMHLGGVTWSLATEEQFYLLAPLLILTFANTEVRANKARTWLWLLLIALPVVRSAAWVYYVGDFFKMDDAVLYRYMNFPFHVRCDGLVLGLLIANYDVLKPEKIRGFLGSIWTIAGACLLAGAAVALQRQIFGFAAASWVFGATTVHLMTRKYWCLRWLEWKGFYIVSRLSFGMYLNHQLIHFGIYRPLLPLIPGSDTLPVIHSIASVAVISLLSSAAAIVTYALVEFPFLQLRERMFSPHKATA